MQQSELQWFQKWYQDSMDHILLYDNSEHPVCVWKNRNFPFQSVLFNILTNTDIHKSSSTLHPFGGNLHNLTIHPCTLDQVSYRFVQVNALPLQQLQWQNTDWRHQTENKIAAMRQQIFGISNAVSALYEGLDDCKDEGASMLLEEQWQQLNIIKGNCCRLMQPTVYLLEQCKYYHHQEITGEVIFLDHELSNFVVSCRNVLGNFLKMSIISDKHLCIYTNRKRLQNVLLCLILQSRAEHPNITQMQWKASTEDESVLLHCTCAATGAEASVSRHSTAEVLYQTNLAEPYQTIISLFCQTYHVSILYANTDDSYIFTLRFPKHQPGKSFTLQSSASIIQHESFSPFQIFLSDISGYRFY